MRYVVEYLAFVRGFSRRAKLYMVSFGVWFLAMSLVSVDLNLYLLRIGHGEGLLGLLVFYVCISSMVFALPVGRTSGRLGGWRSLLLAASAVSAAATLIQALRPSTGVLVAASWAAGAARCVWLVSYGPLLADTSTDAERPHLFGLQAALLLAVSVVGNWLGGALPRFIGTLGGTAPDAAPALRGAVVVAAGLYALSILPLLPLREHTEEDEPASAAGASPRPATGPGPRPADPSAAAREPGLASAPEAAGAWLGLANPALVTKLVIRNVLSGLAAGLFVPLLNVFMYGRLGATPVQIGLIMGAAAGIGGVSALSAPLLGRRWGRIRVITACGLVGLPLLAAQGFAPTLGAFTLAYFVRAAVANVPAPLIDTFYMEVVTRRERGMMSSLSMMSWDLSWAVGGWLCGFLMQNVSYTLPYTLALALQAAVIAFFFLSFRSYDPPLRRRQPPISVAGQKPFAVE